MSFDAFQAIQISNQAKNQNKIQEQDKEKQKQLYETQIRAELKSKASDHFESEIANKIRQAALKGNNEITLNYDENSNGLRFQFLAEEAQHRGFKTRFYGETVNHGDSAAPCVIDEHYLVISW
jgi:hypothetical protein